MSVTETMTYERACAEHVWRVPERYNIATDVCDKHPREKLAMIHEDFTGAVREVSWGEIQDDAARIANALSAHGVGRGDRVAMLLPATPETAAAFMAVFKLGAILLSMSVLYGDDGIEHRVRDSQSKVVLTNAANQHRIAPEWGAEALVLDAALLAGQSTEFATVDTSADDPAQLYYTSGTTGLAKGILHAHRYILAHEEFVYCHEVRDGERFHGNGRVGLGGGHQPAVRPLASGCRAGRLPAQGGL